MSNLITDIGRAADEADGGFVCVQFKIDKLIAKNKGQPPVCKNAEISDSVFTDWGFSVIVRGTEKGDLKGKAYKPEIKKLPYMIVKEASYFTVADNFIFAWLKKKDDSQSWETEIMNDTLEKTKN